ncbi:MAG: heparinase II/III family protein [Rhodospirillales bacterium]|nr:heparinase II/III family protein [Rhodospirillales bacterium]
MPWFASPLYASLCLAPRRPDGPLRFPPALWPGDPDNGGRIIEGSIRLMGGDHPMATPVNWRAQGHPLLWRFTLHYFEWLADLEAIGGSQASARARALMDDWMAAHPRPDAVAWHPYPLSLRVYAWLRHGPFVLDGAEGAFGDRYRDSLDRQARHLARVVERDIGGNHLIKNLKALIAVQRCLDGQTGAGAKAFLEHEVSRQVLADGGHYERSPSYHLQVLCDLLDLRELIAEEAPPPDWLEDAIARMGGALTFFRHGDGGLALFNDGDVGAPRRLAAVDRHLGGGGATPSSLPESGYHRMAAGGALILMDAGPCCPDDLPAHAHADTLSFEFSHHSQRFVVNCGTYAYQDADWRNRLRGTASHSTVCVEGEDSAEVYGTFRLGRRPREARGTRYEDASGIRVVGRHDGYRHLGLIHHRSLTLSADGRCLAGEDRIDGSGAALDRGVAARFHLHPDVAAKQSEPSAVDLHLPGGGSWRFEAPGEEVRLRDSVYAPRFNEMRDTDQIVVKRTSGGEDCIIGWEFRLM